MIVRQGAVYHFRRRVPQALVALWGKTEVWFSLRTSERQLARARAAAIYFFADRVFRRAMRMSQYQTTVGDDYLFLAKYLKQAAEHIAAGGDGTALLAEIDDELGLLESRALSEQQWAHKGRDLVADAQAHALGACQGKVGRLGARLDRLMPDAAPVIQTATPDLHATMESMRQELASLRMVVGRAPAPSPAPAAPDASSFLGKYAELKEKKGLAKQGQGEEIKAIELFLALAGDKPLDAYTRDDICRYRDTLERLPVDYGRSEKARQRPITDRIAEADRKKDVPRLSRTTLDKHWGWAKAFLNTASAFAEGGGHRGIIPSILVAHVWSANVPKAQKRNMWPPEPLTTLFHSPLYTGCKGRRGRWQPGSRVIKDSLYWLPLLGLYTGARAEELARLRPQDIHCEQGIWLFNITTEGLSRIKGESAVRKVPLHDDLIRFGFLAHVVAQEKAHRSQLFPELSAEGVDGKLHGAFSDRFTRYRTKIGIYQERMDFHALRKTFSTLLIQQGQPILIVDELTGHDSTERKEIKEYQSVTISNYYDGAGLPALKRAINAYSPGVDLSHLYVSPPDRRRDEDRGGP